MKRGTVDFLTPNIESTSSDGGRTKEGAGEAEGEVQIEEFLPH